MQPTIRVTCGFLIAALAGCGVESSTETAPPLAADQKASSLESAFSVASREYQVPEAVLKAIAYVETRVSPTQGLKSQAGGRGMMGLSERDDWKMVTRAQELTGASVATLALDPATNVRGAAAVLRELGDKAFRSTPSLNPHDLADWYHVVALYPGYDSAVEGHDYAADVYLRIEEGFSIESGDGFVTLAPTASDWRRNAPVAAARKDALGGSEYPAAVAYVNSPNQSSGRSTYEFVLIHTMQGSYAGTKSWFLNTSADVSSHYIVRSSDGEITQMVKHANTAWHAQCYNARSVGIEHEGFVADPGRWYTENMYRESAKLTRYITDRHGIPRNRSRIIGHVEVAPNCNTGRHTDPGSGWNWTKYMAYVNGTTPTQTTGVLTGLIFTGGNSANRVAGATVTAGGQTATTGADGLYTFNVQPGTYTVNVTKGGFAGNSVSRVVTAGATTWGSMEINASAATGTLRGKVFVFNAADPDNMDQSVSGATVTVNPGNRTATTGADGTWLFSLAPGTYTVSASKTGYATNSQTRTVVASAVAWGSVGLSSSGGADLQAPALAISYPLNDAKLDVGVIDVKGTASDDRGAVSTVKLSLNGGAATDVPVASGQFSVQVKLKPGTNTLKLTGADAAGNAATINVNATFNAGVAGFVYAGGDESARVKDVTVELRSAADRSLVVSTTKTDATGAYALPVMTVPDDYVVVAKAPGFMSHSETVSVPDDKRLELNVSLTVGEGEVGDQFVKFTDPADGSTVSTESVTAYVTAEGFDLESGTINDLPAEVVGRMFVATVPLKEGDNTLTAVARGLDGESATATIHVIRKSSGLSGVPGGGNQMKSTGGCSAAGGLELLALAVLVPALRRRRQG